MKKKYKKTSLGQRSTPDDPKQNYRNLSLRLSDDGTPKTLDADKRSVDVLASTENPVAVFDYERWEIVDEILLMDGCKLPANRQVPLLDTHSRHDTSSVIGSFRNTSIDKDGLVGKAFFSSTLDAETPWTKVREGHLTDFSVGYRVDEATWINAGDTAVINGRTFEGPVKVVTAWAPRELSVCPIGADEQAKARSEPPKTQEKIVDKKLRAFLERRGLAKDATEEEAYAFMERMDVPKEPEPKREEVDVDGERKAATGAERSRIKEIDAMGARFNCSEVAKELIEDGVSVDEARKAIMDQMPKPGDAPQHRAPVEVGKDEREKFRSAATDGVLLRAGVSVKEPLAGADDLAGYTMVELARKSLRMAGLPDRGRPLEMVGRAMTTSEFPLILADSAHKSLGQGFEAAPESWSQWCAAGAVSDFKTYTAPRASELGDLDEVPESTEFKYGDRDEAKEQYSIATYGKLFAITRQALINDDLSALSDTPSLHGESAARKIGDVAYAVLTANAAMGDGTALFHADHSNLLTGAAPGVSSIAAGIKAMGTQKDIKGKRRLNISPQFFLAPKALEGAAEVFFRSERFDDTNKAATTVNPYSGSYFQRIYESRLDDDSATIWYMLAAMGKTVKMFFLDGVQAPYMETKQGWSVDGIEYKVRIDAGAKAMDWRGMSKNPGA